MSSESEYESSSSDEEFNSESFIECPICLSKLSKNNKNVKPCSICKESVCLSCQAITQKGIQICECINCFNKECQECMSDITIQYDKYLETNDLPLYIDVVPEVLNCKECFSKFYN